MKRVKLSVLIPSTPHRLESFLPRVLHRIDEQIGHNPYAEVICIVDNERMSIGEKINNLYELARGQFVSIVADDDLVRDDYITSLLETITEHPDADVIVFDCAYYVGGEFVATIKEGKGFAETSDRDDKIFLRKPSEKMCWRREFVLKHPHIDTWETNDLIFARGIEPHIGKEIRIDRTLYDFYYEPSNERGKQYREALDRRWGKPRLERGWFTQPVS